VDLIKVHDFTPREAYFAIANEAARQRLPVAGHVPIGVSVEEAIAAGQRDVEHLSNLQIWKPCSGGEAYRPDACRPFFETLARAGVWQTPTLVHMREVATIGTPRSELDPQRLTYASRSVRQGWRENQKMLPADVVDELRTGADIGARVAADMARAGVGILVGCDMMIAGFCVHDELQALVRGGMTPLAALQAATINPARAFGLEQSAGAIRTGLAADLVLLDGDPLRDIANTRRIRAVILGGRLLDRRALHLLLAQVEANSTR
jgi:hypothetical protein